MANSTVFGGIAGDSVAAWVRREGRWRDPDEAALAHSCAWHEWPFRQSAASLEPIRKALFDCMWQDVGTLRTADDLQRALRRLDEHNGQLARTGVVDDDRAFILGGHDWLNLRKLSATSRVIATSALAREDSRGAHFREDFAVAGDLPSSTCLVVRQDGEALSLAREPVRVIRVAPGR